MRGMFSVSPGSFAFAVPFCPKGARRGCLRWGSEKNISLSSLRLGTCSLLPGSELGEFWEPPALLPPQGAPAERPRSCFWHLGYVPRDEPRAGKGLPRHTQLRNAHRSR